MLDMLLRALVLDHALAQHHILRLLCGLVSNEATQAEVVSAGVVRAVQEMGNRDMHASDISLILFNISCNPSLSGRYVQLLLESCAFASGGISNLTCSDVRNMVRTLVGTLLGFVPLTRPVFRWSLEMQMLNVGQISRPLFMRGRASLDTNTTVVGAHDKQVLWDASSVLWIGTFAVVNGTVATRPATTPLSLSAIHLSLLEEILTVPMLVELMKKHKPFVQAACLGALQNLSSVSSFHLQLLERGVLEALDSSKDVDGEALSAQCAAVLYNFSFVEKSITKMMELGGIFLVTHLSYSNVIKVSHHMSFLAVTVGVFICHGLGPMRRCSGVESCVVLSWVWQLSLR